VPDPTSRGAEAATVVQVVLSLDRGGLETMAVDLAVALQQRGIRSVMIALDEGGVLESKLSDARVEYIVLNGRRFKDPQFHLNLAAHLRRVKTRVVHTHSFGPLFHSLPSIVLAGVRHVVNTEHSFEYLEPRRDLRRVLRWMSGATRAFTLVGERMLPFYRDNVRVSSRRLQVITNGIDVGRFRSNRPQADIRAELGVPADAFVIGSAGRLAPVKNYPMLLTAAAEARAHGVPVHVALFGEGAERSALAEQAQSLGLEHNVSFLGWRTDLHRVMGALDVFVLTSVSEGLPLALLEAMAAGLPIVSTAVGDIPRVVDEGRSGYLIARDDVAALANRLRCLASDPAVRSSIGEFGRQSVVEKYSQDTMVQRYMSVYGPR
jgi:glycosyltransferase involved in cell wall biosynthesis